MEKYLPNQSIVESPFDVHPSGILASLSYALLGTHPQAAGVERHEISLYLRRGRRKRPACKAIFLSIEGQAWMEGQDQLLSCSSSNGSNLFADPSCFLHHSFFSSHCSRIRLWLVLELYRLRALPGSGEWTGSWKG